MLRTAAAILALVGAAEAFSPSLRMPSMRPAARASVSGLRMADCPLIPLGSNLILEMDTSAGSEQMTSSGIMIAATVKTEGPKTGYIRAIGNGWKTDDGTLIPIDEVKVGDKVMFREPGGLEARKIKIKEGEFFVLSVNDILAKIPE